MAAKRLADRRDYRGKVLTLRMSEQEMLKFRLAAISLGRKRAEIIRERVADLIGGAGIPPAVPTGGPVGKAAGGEAAGGEADDGKMTAGKAAIDTVTHGAGVGGEAVR